MSGSASPGPKSMNQKHKTEVTTQDELNQENPSADPIDSEKASNLPSSAVNVLSSEPETNASVNPKESTTAPSIITMKTTFNDYSHAAINDGK